MSDRSGYIGRSPGDSAVIIASQTFEPTGIQTDFTFASGYTVGYLDVYFNGARLIYANDYTAANGTTVGLTTYANNGDVIECVAYKAFNVGDVTQAKNNFSVGDKLTVSGVTTATSAYYTGSVTASSFSGDGSGLTGVASTDNIITGVAVTIGGILRVTDTTESTSSITGAVIVSGGVGIAKSLHVGGNVSVGGTLTYEDVTNQDVLGLSTFRSGVQFGVAGVGGTIDGVGNAIISGITTVGTALSFADNIKAKFGDSGDLSIYHDGSGSYIKEAGTGQLYIQGDNMILENAAGANYLVGFSGGEVILYYNDNAKFETHNTGVKVTGIATVTSTIYMNTNGSSLAENNLNFASSGKAYIDHRTTSQDIDFRVSHGSALDRTAITVGSAGVTTFYDTPHDDIGSLRSIPLQDESSTANYILVASDAGQCVHAHSSTTQVTVNPSVFSTGDAVTIVNGSAGNIALTQGTSMTIRNTADSSTGSKTLASFGMCTLWFSAHNMAYLSGAGLS